MGNYSTLCSLLWIIVLINFFLPLISFKHAWALGNETDRLALLAIKEHFLAASPWNASVHFCEWEGVECDPINSHRVTGLKLGGLNLGGSISPSIGNLTFLRQLNLSNNKLQGNIPKELGYLKELRRLCLSGNNLQGNIPIQLANCSNLQTINLNDNNLTGKIPFQLADSMNNLIALSLGGNDFNGGIPSSLGNLSSLAYIDLENNHLEGIIPNTLGRLSMLETFAINNNSLSGNLPSSFYNLSSLTFVDMTLNNLSGSLAPQLGFAFPKLEIFYLGVNQLSGSIPKSITNISSLKEFDISSNGFSGLVPHNMGNLQDLELLHMSDNNLGSGKAEDLDFLSSLNNCSQFKKLAVAQNKFGGFLPANLSTQLVYLYLGDNQISGSIPEGIGNLLMLTDIQIQTNLLTGNIPSSIGKLQKLVPVDLSENGLFGEIPSSIGNLSQLSHLYLNDNKLEGRIPITLGKCKKLEWLDVSHNKLGDSIPYQLLAGFESLKSLVLSYNSLTGPLPSNISYSKNLEEFCVDNNNFFGEIPMILGDISSLRTLHMQGNYFQGSIPVSLGLLRAIDELDLSSNSLSGTIPLEFQNLPFLTSLNLSFNQLEGEVPREGVFKNISKYGVIGNKQLCGGIPELELPECFNQETEKRAHGLSAIFIIVIIFGISLALIVVVVVVVLCWRESSRIKEMIPMALLDERYLRVSYKELLEATSGFAASNLIGCGSFGSVYRGILPKEKPVAIKVLNLQNIKAMKSFRVECEALRNIRHRNLVKVITSCSSIDYQGNDFKALVLNFMANGSLDSWLHDDGYELGHGHLNFGQMLNIAIDVANALDYLHHHCKTIIVHRDLKPSNVLLDEDMVAHVSDFGMAKFFFESANNITCNPTPSSIISGTIGYVAPEYGMGFPASPEGDIYSYGVLLLEMITGKRPTDEVFDDGLNLHNLCKMALLQQLERILHSSLLQLIDGDDMLRECLVSFTNVGVSCSVEAPAERMKIEDAITELHEIKAKLYSNKLI